METEMIMTTTPSIAGKRIKEYLGVVTGEAIMGAHLFKDVFAGIRDMLGPWQDKYPSAYPLVTTENGKIRFQFADLDSPRRSPESKWLSEEDVWCLDVGLSEIDEEAARLLKELYSPRKHHLRLVKD